MSEKLDILERLRRVNTDLARDSSKEIKRLRALESATIKAIGDAHELGSRTYHDLRTRVLAAVEGKDQPVNE